MNNEIKTQILIAIKQGIERLPDGKIDPAQGIVMAIDASALPVDIKLHDIAQELRVEFADLFDHVMSLGYKSIWLVGKDKDNVAWLWGTK